MVNWSSLITCFQHFTTKCMIGLTFWICCYGVNPSIPFNESIFAFILLFSVSYFAGTISKLFYLPSVIGMLFAGIIFANVPSFQASSPSQPLISIDSTVSSFIRDSALAIILLRAGLSLNPTGLHKLSWVCLRLAIFPCIVEACVLAMTTYYTLGLPVTWCLVAGFVCAATSPTIIVPSMVSLQKEGFGIDKGIPTLAIGGSSIDDVLAITGFEVFLGLAMSTSTTPLASYSFISTLQGPIEAISGLILGTSLGLLFWFLPPTSTLTDQSVSPCNPNQPPNPCPSLISNGHHLLASSPLPPSNDHSNEAKMRLCLLLFTGIGFIFLTKTLTIDSMGPLGALSVAFVSGLRWRREGYLDIMVVTLKDIWFFCEILLFALIGYEVSFEKIDLSILFWSLGCLFIGLITRTLTVYTVVSGSGLNRREKLFLSMAWLTKGTVQAAVGSIPLEFARSRSDQQSINYGLIILNYAVLSIIISAPLGAWLINFFSKRFLTKSKPTINFQPNQLQSSQDEATTNDHV